MIVVFDINILASATSKREGLPARIVDSVLRSSHRMAISEEMLVTLDGVLARPYFANRVSEGARIVTLEKFRQGSMIVRRDPSIVGVGDDYEDDGVIGAAITAQADFIVSGDKGMLAIGEYRGARIISAREFLDVLGLLKA